MVCGDILLEDVYVLGGLLHTACVVRVVRALGKKLSLSLFVQVLRHM